MSLSGKNIVVTGGTGILGSAVVLQALELGATCYIPCYDESELERFPATDHERVKITIGVDLTEDASAHNFFQTVPALWASVHIAGGFAMARIDDVSRTDLDHMVRMNLTTSYLSCREAVLQMRASGGGRIVNVSARPAIEPRTGAGMTAYVSSKAAVAAMTQALAEEVVSDGILVNAVVPSIIDTPANRSDMPDADFDAWPKPGEIAETILFLASPDNKVTRGALVSVFGKG